MAINTIILQQNWQIAMSNHCHGTTCSSAFRMSQQVLFLIKKLLEAALQQMQIARVMTTQSTALTSPQNVLEFHNKRFEAKQTVLVLAVDNVDGLLLLVLVKHSSIAQVTVGLYQTMGCMAVEMYA